MYHDTFFKLFYTFCRYPGGWAWTPMAGGSSWYGLLENLPEAKLNGECLHFVENLYLLCRAPDPYGLGMSCDEVAVVGADKKLPAYEGEYRKGFVSVHNGVYHGLRSNVQSCGSYAGPPLYSWANHKVLWIKSRDMYYDPCYGKNYQELSDMAAYQYTGEAVFMDGSMNIMTAWQKGTYAWQAKRDGRYFYFRIMSTAEQLQYGKTVMGPYTETELDKACMRIKGLRVL